MATEIRLVLDEDGPRHDPAFIHRAITEGRILSVREVPDACPRCAYTPEHLDWCPEKPSEASERVASQPGEQPKADSERSRT